MLLCYYSDMSISEDTISDLVKMLLRGIKSPVPVDPIKAADAYQDKVSEVGADYPHYSGCGYLYLNEDDVMLVHWTGDGVEFDEHTDHPMTLDFIKIAVEVLRDHQRKLVDCEIDEDSDDDFEWI